MIPPSFLPCLEKGRGEDGCPFFGCEPCFELFLGFLQPRGGTLHFFWVKNHKTKPNQPMPCPIPAVSAFSILALPCVTQVWLLFSKPHLLLLLLLSRPFLFNRLHLPSSLFFFADLERDCFAAVWKVWKALIRGKIDKIVKHVPAVHLLGWRQPGFVLGEAGGQLLTILKCMKSLITTYRSQSLIAWPRAEQRAQPQP